MKENFLLASLLSFEWPDLNRFLSFLLPACLIVFLIENFLSE